jgi:hypothetical protein
MAESATRQSRERERLNHEVAESRTYPGHWHVEAVGIDGEVYVAVFSGPNAQHRAAEYADWKNRS